MNKKWSVIIPIVVFIVMLVPTILGYQETTKYYHKSMANIENVKEECDKLSNEGSDLACLKIDEYKVSFFGFRDQMNINSLETTASKIFLVVSPFILITLFVLPLLTNKSARIKDYKKVLLNIIEESYKIVWAFPLIIFLKDILTFIGASKINAIPISYLFLSITDFVLAFFFMSIIINIALMGARFIKQPLYYLVGGLSFYTIVAFIINLFGKIFPLRIGKYFNIFSLDFIKINYLYSYIIITLLFILSSVALYVLFKDKKKFINYVKKSV